MKGMPNFMNNTFCTEKCQQIGFTNLWGQSVRKPIKDMCTTLSKMRENATVFFTWQF